VASTEYIALLRAINVGTGRKVPMADLRALMDDAGATDVATYIQSGNVVFGHEQADEAALRDDLETRLEAAFGFAIPVLLRTTGDVAALVAGNPFPVAEPTRPLVSFLRDAPPPGALDGLDVAAFAPEAFVLAGREIYLDLPAGVGRAKLPQALARAHGMPETTRNWRTVRRLLDMAQSR
jgi:uncharacterized protein (DUF1697 family)